MPSHQQLFSIIQLCVTAAYLSDLDVLIVNAWVQSLEVVEGGAKVHSNCVHVVPWEAGETRKHMLYCCFASAVPDFRRAQSSSQFTHLPSQCIGMFLQPEIHWLRCSCSETQQEEARAALEAVRHIHCTKPVGAAHDIPAVALPTRQAASRTATARRHDIVSRWEAWEKRQQWLVSKDTPLLWVVQHTAWRSRSDDVC